MQIINTSLLKNPLNWLTVLLMLVLFGIAADVVLRHNRNMSSTLTALAGHDDKTD